ncbi:hypothetical protein K0651_12615 [Ornithinimicrobium sp. Arc0846-15]|nr:hypothetical protein [Ornithinimicrobium laminariae]
MSGAKDWAAGVPGVDVVDAIRAMRDGKGRFFMGMGGNFVRATPDSAATEAALTQTDLTVQVSTKLNSSHAITGKQALILPTLGRTEKDETGGHEQFVSVEDSMSMVHASWGRLKPASPHLCSEVDIVVSIAEHLLTDSPVDWASMRADYGVIRSHIEAVVPGFADYERRAQEPGGFVLPNGPRDSRTFATETGKARLTVNALSRVDVPQGRLLLQTMRSHDQYNTTIYGLDDRYRGVHGERRVLFINPVDRFELGFEEGALIDIISEWPLPSGEIEERRGVAFALIDYPETAPGCVAAYFPEANVLVPLDSTAERSQTPTSKSVVVRLEASAHTGALPQR